MLAASATFTFFILLKPHKSLGRKESWHKGLLVTSFTDGQITAPKDTFPIDIQL